MKKIRYVAMGLLVSVVLFFAGCKQPEKLSIKPLEKQWIGVNDTIPNIMFDISVTKEGYLIIAEQNQPLAEALNLLQDTYFYIDTETMPIRILPQDNTSGHIIATTPSNSTIQIPYSSLSGNGMVVQYGGKNIELKVSPKSQKLVNLHSTNP